MLDNPDFIVCSLADKWELDVAMMWVPSYSCLDYAKELVESGVIQYGVYVMLSGEFLETWEYLIGGQYEAEA